MNHTSEDARVITHDSTRVGERPIVVVVDDTELEIREIEDRWISTGVDTSAPVIRGYIVRCQGGARFKLEHSSTNGWKITILPGPKLVSDA